MPLFPLPPNFFQCSVPLTAQERRQYLSEAREITSDVIRKSNSAYAPMQWTLTDSSDDVQIYHGLDATAPLHVVSCLGVTTVHATLEEAASHGQIKKKTILLDAAHLYTIADSDTETACIRWVSVKSPIRSVIKSRDFCLVELQHQITMHDGRDGYETAWTYPHDGVSHLYVETDRPGVLQVNRLIQVDVAGTAPSWILNFIQLKRMRNLKKMDRFFQEQRLSAQTFLSHRNLIPKSSRSRCFLCQSAFSLLKPKSQCQKCGQVMCRSCVKTWNLHISGFDTKVTVCAACTLVPPPPTTSTKRRGKSTGRAASLLS
ncbi:unnamed protein product [Aphanomyces euteiches]